ncbi:MAG: hypothetical protein GEV06_18865 [Luteitalea sp.]|nr:hypothetical protein [Luteitalea sp.]
MPRYDVIVVGARCAGAPLALLLAKRGAKVLLVDRATFPSDIPHGHFIHRRGPRLLKEWACWTRSPRRHPRFATWSPTSATFRWWSATSSKTMWPGRMRRAGRRSIRS